MENDQLSWQHVVSYVLGISLSATLLMLGKPPEVASLPSFLVWMMINRKNSGPW
jgi:hypothetical protein